MKPTWPHVSIVIPVKNSRRDLHALLQSFKNLDYPPDKLEMLVVDNGSKDGTDLVPSAFPGVRLLCEPRPGSYAARNKGIRESAHPLIAFMDADCRATSSWLKELVTELDPEVGAVAGDNRALQPGHPLSRMAREIGSWHKSHPGCPEHPAYAITMNVLYRRDVFASCGLFDDSQISGSDSDMAWRMQLGGRWKLKVLQDKALVLHRDATNLRDYIRREVRIGQGMYALFRKYPAFLPVFLQQLPPQRRRLILQTLKDFRDLAKHTLVPQKNPVSLKNFLSTLQRFLVKWGYLLGQRQSRSDSAGTRSV